MDYDLAIIGSGPGGYVAAIRAAQLGLKTVCIEKRDTLGGTCLNVGCIPSKALLHSSHVFSLIEKEAPLYGIEAKDVQLDFSKMMAYKNSIVEGFTKGIAFLFKKISIDYEVAQANIKDAHTISLSTGKTIQAKNILLSTGSEPISLPFLKIDEKMILSSTGALALDKLPKKLLVVGAGVIGVELGSVYSRLGVEVTFVEFLDRICPGVDTSCAKALQKSLEGQNMQFHLSHKVVDAKVDSDQVTLSVENPSKQIIQMQADKVLVCIGRKPYTENLGLENVGIETVKGLIPINKAFQTSVGNIYAIGDIVEGPMLAHKASEEGVIVAEYLASYRSKLNYLTIPSVAYTMPEVASVGLSEEEAKKHFSIKVGQFPFKANSRAKCTHEDDGFVKVIADEKTNKLLGMHIVCSHASELICFAGLALQLGACVDDIADLCFAHPTLSECIKEACLSITKGAIHL